MSDPQDKGSRVAVTAGLRGVSWDQQSLLAPGRRIARTPGGRPTKLFEAQLPAAHGIVLVSPHPGQGVLLLNALDPSVTDENDATSCDAALGTATLRVPRRRRWAARRDLLPISVGQSSSESRRLGR